MLPGQVVNGDFHYQRIAGIIGHIFLQIISFREILGSYLSQKLVFLLFVNHLLNTPETNNAGKVVPPLAGILHRLGKNRKTNLIIGTNGIQFMPGLGTVEV